MTRESRQHFGIPEIPAVLPEELRNQEADMSDTGDGAGYGGFGGFFIPAGGYGYIPPLGASMYNAGYMLGHGLMGFGTGETMMLFSLAEQQRAAAMAADPRHKIRLSKEAIDKGTLRVIWKCGCGTMNSGKFCSECGNARSRVIWLCSCGELNQGRYCTECGAPRPEAEADTAAAPEPAENTAAEPAAPAAGDGSSEPPAA